ncbi:MAG: hypothetical protein MH825_13110 [Cyanobacteria bacterium]|nr:hypothetical protein [Cyanobacteriota bacterium]
MSAIVPINRGQLQQAYGDSPAALPSHRTWAQDRVNWAMQQIAAGAAERVIEDLQTQQAAIARHFESRLNQLGLTAQRQQELYSALAENQAAIAAAVGTLTTAIHQQTAAIQDHRQTMQAHGMAVLDNSKRLDQLTQEMRRLAAATENAAIVQQAQADLRHLPPSTGGRVDHHHHHSDSMGYVGPVIAAAMAATIVGAAVWGPSNVPQQTQIRVQMGGQ